MHSTPRPDGSDVGPELETETSGLGAFPSSEIAEQKQQSTKPNGPVATDWRAPTELPDLRRAGLIALDTEVNDEGLRADRGSAWPWRGGYICGISVAWRAEGGIRGNYFPLRHPDSENFDCEQVFQWA